MKKFLVLALALSMALCLSVSALAADQTSDGSNVEITVSTVMQLPKIEIVIGQASQVTLNPYHMSFTPTGGTATTEGFVSTAVAITNKSQIGIKVIATATEVTTTGNLELLADETQVSGATVPSLFMAIAMKTATDETTAKGYSWTTGKSATDDDATLAIIQKDVQNTASIELAAPVSPATATYGAYKFVGTCGGKGWTSASGVTVKIVFSFEVITPTT